MITTTFTAKEAKNNFGRLLDEARYASVGITRNGRLIVVVISIEKYTELVTERDSYLGKRTKRSHTAKTTAPLLKKGSHKEAYGYLLQRVGSHDILRSP